MYSKKEEVLNKNIIYKPRQQELAKRTEAFKNIRLIDDI